ncbi:hypothetical protein [Candidatus Magnetomonas plexicatena]
MTKESELLFSVIPFFLVIPAKAGIQFFLCGANCIINKKYYHVDI